jgi:hypothetical protein
MLFFATSAFSQPNQTEAKAAYLLAEESYGKGDYKSDPHTVELYMGALERLDREIGYLEERINKIEGKLIPAELF